MKFAELIYEIQNRENDSDLQIKIDSRNVKKGDVFVAISGTNEDGNVYITAAIEAGASIVVCNEDGLLKEFLANKEVEFVIHESPRQALWQLAKIYYNIETLSKINDARIIGITGTNGKTTCAYLLEHLFTRIGYKVGVMGTVSYRWPNNEIAAPLTTPDSITLYTTLAKMLSDDVDIIIMEVSSHALDQERVGGIEFAGAIFTNLTQDHLDFHKEMQGYFEAKSKLFTVLPLEKKAIAINADDSWGRKLLSICPHAHAFSLQDSQLANESIKGQVNNMSPDGILLEMNSKNETWILQSPLVGAFNASNLLAVQTLALAMGVKSDDLKCLEEFYGVCGRLERVQNKQNLNVFVDYAHTPDALVNVLQALRGAGFSKIITVFGCGGNRDRTKRPLMGQAVADYTDVAVLTSDNPRFEEPQEIINDVLPGLKTRQGLEIIVEVDRKLATQKALQLLQNCETNKTAVLIAGKGHEDYQIIKGIKHPYSDQQTVQELL